MSTQKEVALEFMTAPWAGDLARWLFQLGMPQAKLGRGRDWPAREALQRIVDDMFGKFDPDGFSVTPTRVIAEGHAVAIEYEASGRTATGRDYQNYYVCVLTIKDGKVSEVRPHNGYKAHARPSDRLKAGDQFAPGQRNGRSSLARCS